jgi:hypothetical protein
MRKQILLGLGVVLVAAVITYAVVTRNAPSPKAPLSGAAPSEAPPAAAPLDSGGARADEPAPALDPNDPTANWPQRYRGRPLLLVLEAYVLDTIEELPPQMQERVPELVERAFGGKKEDWRATVRGQLRWKPEMDQAIRDDWNSYQAKARSQGVEANSLDFAQQFADLADQMMKEGPGDAGR